MTIKGGKMTILKSGKRVWWERDLIPSGCAGGALGFRDLHLTWTWFLQKRSVNQCQSLEELATHFNNKLLRINHLLTLRNAGHDDKETSQQMLQSLATHLSELEMLLVVMRAELTRRRQALANVQVIQRRYGLAITNCQFSTIIVCSIYTHKHKLGTPMWLYSCMSGLEFTDCLGLVKFCWKSNFSVIFPKENCHKFSSNCPIYKILKWLN